MSTNLDLKTIKPKAKKIVKVGLVHATFIAALVVLLTYLLVVWQISSLATADLSPEDETTVTNSIPKVDKKAVEQITKLEENNSEVRSLFNEARNNPFQE